MILYSSFSAVSSNHSKGSSGTDWKANKYHTIQGVSAEFADHGDAEPDESEIPVNLSNISFFMTIFYSSMKKKIYMPRKLIIYLNRKVEEKNRVTLSYCSTMLKSHSGKEVQKEKYIQDQRRSQSKNQSGQKSFSEGRISEVSKSREISDYERTSKKASAIDHQLEDYGPQERQRTSEGNFFLLVMLKLIFPPIRPPRTL